MIEEAAGKIQMQEAHLTKLNQLLALKSEALAKAEDQNDQLKETLNLVNDQMQVQQERLKRYEATSNQDFI